MEQNQSEQTVRLDDRARRLGQITEKTALVDGFDLLKTAPIAEPALERITGALNHFLWTCLCFHFPERAFPLTTNLLETYEAEILQLPNITPNGLILPKQQNQLAYNLVHQAVANAFAALNLGPHIQRIQYPINIRLQNGRPNAEADARRRASVKPHSDIWAGDPGSGLLVFLAVLGRTENSGIAFSMPDSFPVSMIKTLDDYNDGHEVATKAQPLCRFEEKKWFVVDPYVIHQTIKGGHGLRISIDFRFIPNAEADADFDVDALRTPYFIPYNNWAAFGSSQAYVTNEPMTAYVNTDNQPYMKGYPVKLQTVSFV